MSDSSETYARYTSLGKSLGTPVPLALTVPDNAPVMDRLSTIVGWTSEGFEAFRELRKALGGPSNERSLPYRALIALLEVHVPHITRLDRGAGLFWKSYWDASVSFAWTDVPLEEAQKGIFGAVREWISEYVQPLTKSDANTREALRRVSSLFTTGKLLTFKSDKLQLYPWTQVRNGTTKPKDRDGYMALADFIARRLEGQLVFEGLPPLRRVVGVPGFGSGNQAELLSEPITDVLEEPFSFRLNLKVVSMPGVDQPVVLVDVGKRRWVSRLDSQPFGRASISGYAFPIDGSLAVRFSLEAKQRKYKLGDDYNAIQQLYRLRGGLDGPAVAAGDAHNEHCELYVNYRTGYGRHGVKAGVPELDKIQAFEKVEEILASSGIQRWNPLDKIHTKHKSGHESGLVNAKVLKQDFGLLEDSENKPTAKMFDAASGIIELNKKAVNLHHTEKPVLMIAYHETCRKDAELAKRTILYLVDGQLEVELVNLPSNVHGPRYKLPSAGERNAGTRAQTRLEAWRPLVEPLRELTETENIVGCLVIAPKFYEVNGEWKRDDTVNKPAGRKAIATIACVPVQYLLPAEDDTDDFLLRTQYAWRDLAWAHSGRIDDVAGKMSRLFSSEKAPREIIGITVVQSNDKRIGWKGSLIPVAFKLDVAEGRCLVRFAYEDEQGGFCMTEWEPIQASLSKVAKLSPLTFGTANGKSRTHELRSQRFQQFCEKVITEACDAGTCPLVLMQSTRSASYWKWLTDVRADPHSIDFEKGTNALQQIWSGVRIVRVREHHSPQIVLDKEDRLAHVSKDDTRSKKEIQPDKNIRVPTSPSRKLYRVSSSTFPTYLTVGGKDLHQLKRGRSCYRTTELLDTRDAVKEQVGKSRGGLAIRPLGNYEAFAGYWPTPNPLELVVMYKQDADDPDVIAELVESLRFGYGHYGNWSSLPAPLFFERVVRDYIAEFENEEETDEGIDR